MTTLPLLPISLGLSGVALVASLISVSRSPEPASFTDAQIAEISEIVAGKLTTASAPEMDRTALRGEIRDYLMEDPQLIIDAVNQLEQRQAEAQAQADFTLVETNAEDLFNDGYSWEGGNLEGDITLVEFVDYRCGYCRRAHDEVAELIKTDGNIKLIVKEFPILGDASTISSRFAIATKQLYGADAYKSVHDALITYTGEPNQIALRRIATNLELDGMEILQAMDSDAVTQEIADTRALAQRLQINGTPTFVMKDEMLRGYLPLPNMRALVAQKRSE